MARDLERLEKKKAELQARKEALKAEEAKLKAAVRDQRNKARNGQLHCLGLVIDSVMREADPEQMTRNFIEEYGQAFFTRPVDKKRFAEAIRLIRAGLPLGTLPDVPDSYQEGASEAKP